MTTGNRPLGLVTGASSGIGLAYAERLTKDGWDLVITGRRRERLEELATRLKGDYGATVEVVVADLADEQGIQEINAVCRERALEMLINNAGLGHYMPLLDLPEEDLRELVAVEALAPTVHAQTAAKEMVKRGKGAIITIASLLAFSDSLTLPHFPKRVVYASTKSYVLMFSRLLAEELAGTGVKVQVVCPGLVKTEFHTRQEIDLSSMPRLDPVDVVQASLSALGRDEVVCIPTLEEPGLLDGRDAAQAEMLRAAYPPKLAERYREETPDS